MSTGASRASSPGAAAPTSTRTDHRPASRNASSSASLRVALSVPDRRRSSSCWRNTVTWARSPASAASSRPVGSATTSQPKGRPRAAASADSNRPGGPVCWLATGAGSSSSGSAWRPGQSAQTSPPHAVSQPGAAGPPRAPGGKSKAQPSPACGPGKAALVMNSSGAPPARHSQPATNGRPARAAADAAGRMSRKSCSAEPTARRVTMDRTRYQGPANSSPRTGTGITTCAYQPDTAAATDTGSLPGNYHAEARTGRAAARPRWRAWALAASWTGHAVRPRDTPVSYMPSASRTRCASRGWQARPGPRAGRARRNRRPPAVLISRVGDELQRCSAGEAQPAGHEWPPGTSRGRRCGQDVEEVVFGGAGQTAASRWTGRGTRGRPAHRPGPGQASQRVHTSRVRPPPPTPEVCPAITTQEPGPAGRRCRLVAAALCGVVPMAVSQPELDSDPEDELRHWLAPMSCNP